MPTRIKTGPVETSPAATPPREPLGVLTAPDTVRIDRILPGPIDRVWSYLVDPEKRGKWFAAGPMELREAGPMTLTFRNSALSGGRGSENSDPPPDGVDHVMHGIVLECAPPHRLRFNWNHDGEGSETTFELASVDDGTRIVITHRRLTSRRNILNVASGWHTHIGILLDLVSDQPPRLFWPEKARVEALYAAGLPE